ncbi:MAG: CDP-archaeol synthase [Gammaproteobacteria bacterium]|nr:CDP-archaeol synthase [Gammaproteobacteria bacterium]
MSPILDLKLLLVLMATHGPSILAGWLFGKALSHPLDRGRNFLDGRPLFGLRKTWRGLIAALLGAAAMTPALGLGAITGMLLAFFSMLGDLGSSFASSGVSPSPPAAAPPLLNQLPEALLPLLLLKPALGLGWLDIALTAGLFVLADIALSRLLYRLHIRNRPY